MKKFLCVACAAAFLVASPVTAFQMPGLDQPLSATKLKKSKLVGFTFTCDPVPSMASLPPWDEYDPVMTYLPNLAFPPPGFFIRGSFGYFSGNCRETRLFRILIGH